MADKVDIVTLENEFVDANALARLEQAGHVLYPSSKTIGLVQDKLIQKQTLATAGIPVAPFIAVSSKGDILAAAEELGWPMVLKARRNGYDGKGNATLKQVTDIDDAWDKLDGDERELYVEAFCPFKGELAVMVTRGIDGNMVNYSVVETVQKDHICHIVRAPARIDTGLSERAVDMARKAVTTIDGVGSIGVDDLDCSGLEGPLNEMAPRVHNSGHYTIEACECSQFENHVRAILGLPLGSCAMIAPAAIMINLLGEEEGSGYPSGIAEALSVAGAHVHVYGKESTTAAKHIRFGAEK